MSTPIPFVSGARANTGHLEEFNSTPLEFMHRAFDECGEICEFDLGGLVDSRDRFDVGHRVN